MDERYPQFSGCKSEIAEGCRVHRKAAVWMDLAFIYRMVDRTVD
jgi:hypothetical protein